MKFFNFYTLTSLIIFFSLTNAYGFTIKSGQVLSSDGKVYDFASPAEQQQLREKYEAGGDQVGVFNKNLFIMQDDGIIAVPMGKITGIGKDELNEVINDAFKEYEVKTVKKYVEMPPEDIAKMDAKKLSKEGLRQEGFNILTGAIGRIGGTADSSYGVPNTFIGRSATNIGKGLKKGLTFAKKRL